MAIDSKRMNMQYHRSGKSVAEVADEMAAGKLKIAQTNNILNMTLLLRALAERRVHFEVVPDPEDMEHFYVIPHVPDEMDKLLMQN